MQVAHTMPIPSGRPSGVLDALMFSWNEYRRNAADRQAIRAAEAQLSDLDDAALADIGIKRCEIKKVLNPNLS